MGRVPVTRRDAPDPAPQRVQGFVSRRHHGRMGAQAEIVVGRKRHDGRPLQARPPARARRTPGASASGPRRPPGRAHHGCGRPTGSRSAVRDAHAAACSAVTSRSAPSRASTIRTISSAVVVSGGISTTTSPSGRSSTPLDTAPGAHPPPPPQPGRGRGQLDPDHQSTLADLAHDGPVRDPFSEQRRQLVGTRPDVGEHVPRLDQAQVLERHRRGQRVPAVGVPVVEGLGPEVGAEERVEHRHRTPPWPTWRDTRR